MAADRNEQDAIVDVDVIVVGGGLAGLAAAATAARAGRRVVLVERRRLGGRATTDERDGFLFNQGPRALYSGAEGEAVLARLGIHPTGGAPATADAMALVGDRLAPLPGTAAKLVASRILSVRAKVQVARLLGGLQRIRASEHAHLTTDAWLAGKALRPDADILLRAVIRTATYCDDLSVLSADAAISQIQVALGAGVRYLDGGWAQLTDALRTVAEGSGATVITGTTTTRIERTTDEGGNGVGQWILRAVPDADARGATAAVWRAPAVVLATGGPDAAIGVLPEGATRQSLGWGGLGPRATAACLDLGLRRAPTHPFVMGIGQPLYISQHCPPADLAPAGHTVVQAMRYGARSSSEDRDQLWSLALIAGIEKADVVVDRFLHEMVVTSGIPTAESGGLAGRPPVAVPGHRGVFVAGDWVGPIGMLADASLSSGEASAHAAARLVEAALRVAIPT